MSTTYTRIHCRPRESSERRIRKSRVSYSERQSFYRYYVNVPVLPSFRIIGSSAKIRRAAGPEGKKSKGSSEGTLYGIRYDCVSSYPIVGTYFLYARMRSTSAKSHDLNRVRRRARINPENDIPVQCFDSEK